MRILMVIFGFPVSVEDITADMSGLQRIVFIQEWGVVMGYVLNVVRIKRHYKREVLSR